MTQPELICFLPGVCGKWVDYLVYGLMLVVRNLCNDGLIGAGPLLRHIRLAETILEQPGVPPVITRMLVY